MGREVRRVPAGWNGMRREDGRPQPHFDRDFEAAANKWKAELLGWCAAEHGGMEYWECYGNPPSRRYYRPVWKLEEATHYQLYETATEGTPLSPAFATLEELARWYADNGDPVYGRTLTYEQSLCFVREGWAPTGVFDPKRGFICGPLAIADQDKRDDEG